MINWQGSDMQRGGGWEIAIPIIDLLEIPGVFVFSHDPLIINKHVILQTQTLKHPTNKFLFCLPIHNVAKRKNEQKFYLFQKGNEALKNDIIHDKIKLWDEKKRANRINVYSPIMSYFILIANVHEFSNYLYVVWTISFLFLSFLFLMWWRKNGLKSLSNVQHKDHTTFSRSLIKLINNVCVERAKNRSLIMLFKHAKLNFLATVPFAIFLLAFLLFLLLHVTLS